MDQNTGVFESLSRSQELTYRAGFWNVFVLMLVELALNLLPEFVPFVGTIVSFATTPLAFLVVAAAYRQLMTLPPPETVAPILPESG